MRNCSNCSKGFAGDSLRRGRAVRPPREGSELVVRARILIPIFLLLAGLACSGLPIDGGVDPSPPAAAAGSTLGLPPEWTATPLRSTETSPVHTPTASPAPTTADRPATEATGPRVAPLELPGTPDEPIVAFSSSRDGSEDIFLMRLDGTGLTRLTDDEANDSYPRWSPDGSELAFITWRETAQDDIGFSKAMLIRADGTHERFLGVDEAALFPCWSPDGQQLALAVTTNLATYRQDGTLVRQLRNKLGVLDRYPDWSPNGSLIAFSAFDNSSNEGDIFTINPLGSGLRRVAGESLVESMPSWSPDGEWLAFSANEGYGLEWEVHLIRPDGTDRTFLAEGLYPRWSPDGEWISFMRYGPQADIFLIRPDGTDERQLTTWSGFDGYLDWRPAAPAEE